MPHRRPWRERLAGRGEVENAEKIMQRGEEVYHALRRAWPAPRHLILRYHFLYQILPALAVYRALREEGVEERPARNIISDLAWSEIGPLYRAALWWLKYLRRPFDVWRVLVRLAMESIFPPAGWGLRWIEPAGDCIGFDMVRCCYLDILTDLGAPELTPVFCEMDDRLAGLVPASIIWRRQGTMASGADHCDFRWCQRT